MGEGEKFVSLGIIVPITKQGREKALSNKASRFFVAVR